MQSMMTRTLMLGCVILFAPCAMLGQVDESACVIPFEFEGGQPGENPPGDTLIRGGKFKPTTGIMRVLVVYIRYPDDVTPGPYWPDTNVLPAWAETIVDETIPQSGIYSSLNVSNFFDRASGGNGSGFLGQFQMIGDVHYVTTTQNRNYYDTHGGEPAIDREVLQTLDNQGLDFSEYDNWSMIDGGNYYAHTYVPGVGDGILDFIYIVHRINPSGVTTGAWGSVPLWPLTVPFQSNDGVVINQYSGANIYGARDFMGPFDQMPRTHYIIAHEYMHHALGYTDQYQSHFDTHTFNSGNLGFFALEMSGSPGNMSAYERYRVGWLNPVIVATNQASLTLPETHVQNQAVLLPLRTDLHGNIVEYMLIENFHTLNDYSGANPFMRRSMFQETLTHGLLAYHIENENIEWPTLSLLDIECADGLFNWTLAQGSGTPTDRTDDLIQKGTPGYSLGFDERDAISINVGGTNWTNYKGQRAVDHGCGIGTPCQGSCSWNNSREDLNCNHGWRYGKSLVLGDNLDFLREGQTDVFNSFSNPNTNRNDGTGSNTGVEVLNYNAVTHSYSLKLAVNAAGVLDLKPSKPQYLRATSVQSGNTTLTWYANLETDLIGYKVHRWTVLPDGSEINYTLLTPTPITATTFTDNNYESTTGLPQNIDIYHRYRITTLDNQGKESVKSEFTDAYFTHLATGTISSNRTWQIDVRVIGNATVNSGVTLTLMAGTVVKVNNSYSLTVNGKLIAIGTSSNRISITSSSGSPTPGIWSGILLNGGGPDTLKYFKLDYATTGIFMLNTSGTSLFDHDTISNCSQTGITVSNTQTSTIALKFNYSRIRKNAQYGLNVGTARVDLLQSRIDSNGLAALWDAINVGSGGKLYMKHTRVNNNGGYGIRVSGTGSYAYVNPNGLTAGNNTLNQNGYGEMYIQNSGGAFVGERVSYQQCVCDETIVVIPPGLPTISTPEPCGDGCYWETIIDDHGGYNNIYNSFSFTGRFINNATTPTVKAQLTYWGSSSTPPGDAFIGNVDRANHLSSQQSTLGITVPIAYDEDEEEWDELAPTVGELSWLKGGDIHQLSNDVNTRETKSRSMKSWIYHLISLVEENPQEAGHDATHFLYDLIGPSGQFLHFSEFNWDGQLEQSALTATSASLRKLASTYRIQTLMDRRDFSGAIGRVDQALEQNLGDDLWLSVNVQKIISLAAMGKLEEASSTYQGMRERGLTIDERTVDHLAALLAIGPAIVPAEAGIQGTGGEEATVQADDATPLRFALNQNYPNPFNPSTTISYTLPEATYVTLTIYDLLGREIAELINGPQAAGSKIVAYDARHLPSGIYYYALRAGSYSDIKKMVLIK